MSIWSKLLSVGAGVAAPFTGGASMILPAVLGGVSALSEGLSNREKTTTSTSTTKKVLSAPQQEAQGTIMSEARKMLMGGDADLAPMRVSGTSRINNTYKAGADRLDQELAKRGRSGRGGAATGGLRALETGRLNDLSQLENNIGQLSLQRRDKGLDLLSQILAMTEESTTTSKGTTPGNVAGAAIGAGAEDFTTLLAMRRLLGKSGGSNSDQLI